MSDNNIVDIDNALKECWDNFCVKPDTIFLHKSGYISLRKSEGIQHRDAVREWNKMLTKPHPFYRVSRTNRIPSSALAVLEPRLNGYK